MSRHKNLYVIGDIFFLHSSPQVSVVGLPSLCCDENPVLVAVKLVHGAPVRRAVYIEEVPCRASIDGLRLRRKPTLLT